MFTTLLRHFSSAAFRKGGSARVLHSSTQCNFTKTFIPPVSTSLFPLQCIPCFETITNLKAGKPSVLDKPLTENKFIKEVPFLPNLSYLDKINWNIAVIEPTEIVEKKAARLIVIRRKKMKRHKLKKLRLKMKFEWAKVRQRREMRKEKAFQAELMGKIKETEKFDPAVYVANKLNEANEVLSPYRWKSKHMPEFYFKELIMKRAKKKAVKLEKIERRKKFSYNVTDYKV